LLRLQARLYGLKRHEIDQRVGEVLRMVDIGDAVDRRIGTYSGGMKRRLDLAAALVHNPDIVFLDEPTTGLDPASRALVWQEVRRLTEDLGMTIFLTTQYLEEADELADRVGIIAHGKLVAEGTPGELKRSIGTDVIVAKVSRATDDVLARLRAIDGVDQVDVHENEISVRVRDGAAAISPVAVALAACEVEVHTLTLRTPTLDDVFLELTGTHMEEETQ
jgi:ABC-2 type transport system ATP-binding protein